MVRGGKTGRGSRAAGGREPRPEPNKPTEADLVVEDEATGMVTSAEDEEGREPTIADLASILRAHMGQQHGREVRLKQEAERQEQRFKALQHQFGLLQLLQTPSHAGPRRRNAQNRIPLIPVRMGFTYRRGNTPGQVSLGSYRSLGWRN